MSERDSYKRAKPNRGKKQDEKGRAKRPMPKSGRSLKGSAPRTK